MNHPRSGSILHVSLGELLERLGSSEPTPGGGAAAAMAGALGAALVQMTANLTIGRPRFSTVEDQARHTGQRAAELRQRLVQLADADAAAFDQVSAAYKLPRDDDDQKRVRSQAIQAALFSAAEVPLETARMCAQVLEVAEEAAPILNPAVISDVMVGALLAQAALHSAAVNVEINLASLTHPDAREHLSRQLEEARTGADERTERVLQAGRSRFPGQV